jgi:hypothetical protein
VVSPDLDSLLCPNGRFATSIDNVKNVRPDGEHFSLEGARLVGRWLLREVSGLRDVRVGRESVADQLAAKLTAAGFFCGFAPLPAHRRATDPEATVNCSRRQQLTILRVYSLQVYRDYFVGIEQKVGCRVARRAGQTTIAYTMDDDWIVTGGQPTISFAAKALGAPLRTFVCPQP